MSLVRYLLDDPFFNPDARSSWGVSRRSRPAFDAFDDLWRQHQNLVNRVDELFNSQVPRIPSSSLREEGNEYVVEAELPGVKKEDLDVRIGEGGRSLTIEGRTFRRTGGGAPPSEGTASPAPQNTDQAQQGTVTTTGSKQVEKYQPNPQEESIYSSTFSRTFQFPRPVDGARVSARLLDGVLTLRVPQRVDPESVRVNID